MKLIAALLFATLVSTLTWTAVAFAQKKEYLPPYPHATGAQLLPYCQNTEVVVDQLRCDFYLQAMADLASTPVRGVRLACPPRGMDRTELIALAVEALSSFNPADLENNSAASLLLRSFQKKFRCPQPKRAKQAGGKGKANQQPNATE